MALLLWIPQADEKKVCLSAKAYGVVKTSSFRSFFRKNLALYLNEAKTKVWEKCCLAGNIPSGVLEGPLLNCRILKLPNGKSEKGVFVVQAENNWAKVLKNPEAFKWLNDNYSVIWSSGWSPTNYSLLGWICSSLRDTVFVQANNYDEIKALEEFNPKIKCLRSIVCDWINPDFFRPKPFADREIDILMVAAWAPYKRHWQLFEALKKMPRNLRVALIGQPDASHTVESVRKQASLFGVKQEIEFINSVLVETVNDYQCNSKISVILTKHEGACVAITESLFADSPVAALRGADVGSVKHINKDTGVLLDAGKIHYQLQQFLETGGNYRARAWAMEHISHTAANQKLNALMKDFSVSKGLDWTTDLKPVCWHPIWEYVNERDQHEMNVAYNDLQGRFPGLF